MADRTGMHTTDPNYVDPMLSEAQWQSQYFGSNMNQLIAAKAKWDPRNVFKFPQSIPLSS